MFVTLFLTCASLLLIIVIISHSFHFNYCICDFISHISQIRHYISQCNNLSKCDFVSHHCNFILHLHLYFFIIAYISQIFNFNYCILTFIVIIYHFYVLYLTVTISQNVTVLHNCNLILTESLCYIVSISCVFDFIAFVTLFL